MDIQTSTPVGDIVRDNFRTARIFERLHIDYCCGGKTPLSTACRARGLDPGAVHAELATAMPPQGGDDTDFSSWNAARLTAYIVERHHGYLRSVLPGIDLHARKVADAHGTRHPETIRVAGVFRRLAHELDSHMMKEEQILFPYIDRLALGVEPAAPRFRTVRDPIAMMEREHDAAGEMLAELRSLTWNFSPPEDACTTFRLLLDELREFEEELHIHIHLENNVLHPKAVALENVPAYART